jgi:hypothetical protein
MAKFAALYGSQSDADAALEYLSRLPFYKELETEVIDNTPATDAPAVVVPIVQNSGSYMTNMPGVAPIAIAGTDWDEEDRRFFSDGVRNGGVLVVVEVNGDEKVNEVRRLLRETGGRTARED